MSLDVQPAANNAASGEIARNCLLTRTRQISRVLTAIYDDAIRPFDINASQFTLLVLILELGPLSRSNLARRNCHDRTTLTRNLRPLMLRGLVREHAPAGNGRSRALSVTKQGLALLRDAAPGWSAAQTQAKALIGSVGADALMGIAEMLPYRMS
ncbi:MarR family winged helix-turn-helix transcriptional regulator [Paraburkholderia xenovorans]|uniref:MarR family winged helix-turn-helix transcriptional regulator n=1 Tax=Paraburkholderia xenovorans TaxID=36873 RepID=UPI0038B896FE